MATQGVRASQTQLVKVPADGASKFVGGLFMAVGGFSVFTIVGIIWGVPMAIIGLWMIRKRKGRRGACPLCGSDNQVALGVAGFNCAGCLQRLIVRDGKFVALG